MDCKYFDVDDCGRSKCLLATITADPNGVYISERWCASSCWPNHVPAQLAMLRRFGIDLPVLPKDKDLLEWAKECIENGTVKLSDVAEKARQQKKEAEVERQKLLDQLPKGVELTENLKRHLKEIAVHYVKTGEYYVTDEHEAARLYKCDRCPDKQMIVKDGVMRCALKTCGCYLNNPNNRPLLKGKAKYWATPCDNGHWAQVDENAEEENEERILTARERRERRERD